MSEASGGGRWEVEEVVSSTPRRYDVAVAATPSTAASELGFGFHV